MSTIETEVARRRTFAIISHPDAGKTTLTEKLLLMGGAIQAAGAVKARGDARRARSDWMKVEQERGISVTASAMTFEWSGYTFNLVDTPGHQDFSEDTYRTLTAVDAAVMVIYAAKGIEEQTRKLFEVCRLRDIPIVTFINKLDREGREPFELMDQIEQELALDVTPASWPIGMGRDFLGSYDLRRDRLMLMERSKQTLSDYAETVNGLDDPRLDQLLPPARAAALREEAEMARQLCPQFDLQAFREGHMSPVFFGSALQTFGVSELLSGIAELCPPPRPQKAKERTVHAHETKVSAFVFKIQANMDPKHRDRIAFLRLCSGHFKRGAKLMHVGSGTTFTVHNPVLFLAQDRGLAEEAFAGDILGIPNHGKLRIGDTLTEGEELHFVGIPHFAPELLQRVRATDPLRAKHLNKALEQIAEEGGARVFKPSFGSDWVVGVVGALQFEVLADRIKNEYDVPVVLEGSGLYTARWIEFDEQKVFERFKNGNEGYLAQDHTKTPVFLARNAWHLETTEKDWPDLRFLKTKEH
jgi:peptide chain release factor 3